MRPRWTGPWRLVAGTWVRPYIPAEAVPYHLRLGSVGTRCSGCGRTTWAESEFEQVCNMPQPDGSRCRGTFGTPADFDTRPAP